MTPAPQPYGFIVCSEITGDGYPMFKILRLRESRDEARLQALRDMRNGDAPQCVLFIREDGQHEAWFRGSLEHWTRTGNED